MTEMPAGSDDLTARSTDPEDRRTAYNRHTRSARCRPADTSARRIYELLRASIRDGSIGAGELLTEHALVQTYNGSRNSVRKALQALADEGLLDRTRRIGTSLSRKIVPIAPTDIGPRVYAGTRDEGRLHVDTLECTRVIASPEVERRLQIDSPEVIRLEQLGSFDGEPLYLRTAYLATHLPPEDMQARLDRLHLDYPPLPVVFEAVFDVPYGVSIYSAEAVAVEERVATLLGVAPESPTLLRELTTVDVGGRPRELSFTYFRSGRSALMGTGTFDDVGARLD